MTSYDSAHSAENDVNRARLLNELGRFEQAETLLRQVLASEPDHLAARRQLAAVFVSARRYSELLELAGHLVTEHPEDAEFHRFHGEALLQHRHIEAAIAELREALRLQPGGTAPYMALVIALYGAGHQQDALKAAANYVQLRPRQAQSHATMAIALAGLNRFDEADEAARRALAIDPTSSLGRTVLAMVQGMHGELADAHASMLAVLRVDSHPFYLQMFKSLIMVLGNPAEFADLNEMIQAALGEGTRPCGLMGEPDNES